VLKLVLVSSFAQLRPSSLSQWFYFVQRAIVVHTVGLATQSRIVAQRVFPAADQQTLREMAEQQITSAEPRAYRAAMRSLGLVNLQPRLKEINKPTLVISGANDSTVSPALQKKLTDCIPGARQIIIPGAGHAAAIDQFEVFNRDLNQFLLNC
jgi:pimeloyl-ACP methyl ester carboxylesterase